MSQLNRLVWHESRLELWTLKKIDFHLDIIDVVPQPFKLRYVDESSGRKHWHVPDFLVYLRSGGRMVVNSKLRRYCQLAPNVRAFTAAQRLCDSLHWGYSTECEPDLIFQANLNFLSGYRRRPQKFGELAGALVNRLQAPLSFAKLVDGFSIEPALIKPIVFHMMWRQMIKFEIETAVLDSNSMLSIW